MRLISRLWDALGGVFDVAVFDRPGCVERMRRRRAERAAIDDGDRIRRLFVAVGGDIRSGMASYEKMVGGRRP